MNEFVKNLKIINNGESQEKATSKKIEEYIKRDKRIKEARILKYVAECLETGYFKASDKQWEMIDTIIDELYRKAPKIEEEEKEQEQK